MIRKVHEVDPLICPWCGGRTMVVTFITDFSVVDRIVNYLKLTFVAAKPPSQISEPVALAAAEGSGENY